MSREAFYVYMMTNKGQTTLYIGVTNSLVHRVRQHRAGDVSGFTERYNLNRLVYYEQYNDPRDAIVREKQLKRWRREKKDGPDREDESDVGRFGRECAWARVGTCAGVEED